MDTWQVIIKSRNIELCINSEMRINSGCNLTRESYNFPTMDKLFWTIRSNKEHIFLIDSQH
jgi:hypothetical protein